jgi:CBS domain-containing protein
MVSPLHAPRALRERRNQRSQRHSAVRAVGDSLLSVAALPGAPVVHRSGAEVGRLVDVVVRWLGEPYPPLTGMVVRVGRRLAWVPADKIDEIAQRRVVLRSATLDLRDFVRRPNEVRLNDDVIDHQMVDVDGVRVFRAADLYLGKVDTGYRLVGADVGLGTLLRRLGPARWRSQPRPEQVIDWAAVQPFSDPGGPVRIRRANNELHRLRPGELADLLEELGRSQRQELLDALDAETAADALEEMEADELSSLLREVTPDRAASLVAEMEPDEAADALRDLDEDTRHQLLEAMPGDVAGVLNDLLDYDEETAGGLMTTTVLVCERDATVAEARRRLLARREHRGDIDAVLVVDEVGCLVDDVHMGELFLAEPDQRLATLVSEPWPVTVEATTPLHDVVEAFVENRGSSVVVVDEGGRPIGRILADDVVDALRPDRDRRRRFAGLLS